MIVDSYVRPGLLTNVQFFLRKVQCFSNSLKPPGVILLLLTVVLSFIDSMFGND